MMMIILKPGDRLYFVPTCNQYHSFFSRYHPGIMLGMDYDMGFMRLCFTWPA